MDTETTIDFSDFYKQLDKLAKTLGPEIVEPMLKDKADQLADIVQQNAPYAHVKKGIKVKQMNKRGDNPKSEIVKTTAKDSYWIEYGTSERFRKSGAATGKEFKDTANGHPFFRPAVDSNQGRLYDELFDELKKSVESICE